jgi:hypothetical protein
MLLLFTSESTTSLEGFLREASLPIKNIQDIIIGPKLYREIKTSVTAILHQIWWNTKQAAVHLEQCSHMAAFWWITTPM